MTIRWSARARSDIRELQKYIAKDSPYYARQFIGKIFGAVEKLVDYPKIGRQVPESDRDDIRELIFQGYRIIYYNPTRLCLRRYRCARQPRFDPHRYQTVGCPVSRTKRGKVSPSGSIQIGSYWPF